MIGIRQTRRYINETSFHSHAIIHAAMRVADYYYEGKLFSQRFQSCAKVCGSQVY